MAKTGESATGQTDRQKPVSAVSSIVSDVFSNMTFPAEKLDLFGRAYGVEIQADRGKVLMLSEILEDSYKERFSSLQEVVSTVEEAIEAGRRDESGAKEFPSR